MKSALQINFEGFLSYHFSFILLFPYLMTAKRKKKCGIVLVNISILTMHEMICNVRDVTHCTSALYVFSVTPHTA